MTLDACAEQAIKVFLERQNKAMNHAFSGYIEWLGARKKAGMPI